MSEPKSWPDEAIQLLRTTQQHHVQLSAMADQKANMLVGATFVVFTLAISQHSPENFSLPLVILTIFSFLSAAFAAWAVMPFTSPKSMAEPNWLFFGAFSTISEDEFTNKIFAQMETPENVYRAMLHDIYQLGCTLEAKKYRYLRLAYRFFLIGITLTFLAFMWERAVGALT